MDVAMPEADLSSYVRPCLSGDPQAWSMLVDRLWPVVAGAVWRTAGSAFDQHGLDDICQDVFVKLCDNDSRLLKRYDPALSPLERYVAVIARSTALDHLRKKPRIPLPTPAEKLPEPPPGREVGLIPDIEEWELTAALGTLTDREREVMDNLFLANLTTAETAVATGMSEGTVRSHKMNALAKLRTFFGIGGK